MYQCLVRPINPNLGKSLYSSQNLKSNYCRYWAVLPKTVFLWASIVFVLANGIGLGEFLGLSAYAGTVEGTIYYQGVIPKPRLRAVIKDQEYCGVGVSIQTVHVHDAQGALSGAVVSVEGMKREEYRKDGTKDRKVINMHCAFSPRIGVARLGQDIEVRNQDPILHNTHIRLGKRTILNVAQVPGGKPIVKRLKRSGLHSVRCDKHIFMESSLYVFNHPFYDLTDKAGAFRISGIPPGKHPIQVWHETLGILEKVVRVPKEDTVRIDFAYP